MNDFNTHLSNTVMNHSNQLKFSVERILSSDDNSTKSFNTVRPFPAQFSSVVCPCPGSCVKCEVTRNCSLFRFSQIVTPNTINSINYNGIATNFGNLYRPAPVRPIPRLTATAPTNTTNNTVDGNIRRKRSWSRAVFSSLQRKGLERRFSLQKYITKPDRRQLAATLGLTDAQVKVWFQNRRMKWRHTKESENLSTDASVSNFKETTRKIQKNTRRGQNVKTTINLENQDEIEIEINV